MLYRIIWNCTYNDDLYFLTIKCMNLAKKRRAEWFCFCVEQFSNDFKLETLVDHTAYEIVWNWCNGQANSTDELPERLIGAVRVSHIELSSAIVPMLESDPSSGSLNTWQGTGSWSSRFTQNITGTCYTKLQTIVVFKYIDCIHSISFLFYHCREIVFHDNWV